MKRLLLSILDRMGTLEITVALFLLGALVRLIVRPMVAADTPITHDSVILACLGVAALIVVFRAALALVEFVLRLGGGVFGVARTVLDEAIRMNVAVVFMALLLVIVPVLPFVIGGDDPLRYRVQSFLTYSLGLTSLLLSLMTIFLACGTLSNEITNKQIFTVACKPISRGKYLIGKWLGIVLLDGVLLTVAGAAIYGFTVFYLANLPADNVVDQLALQNEVLVARVTSDPKPKVPLEQVINDQLEKMERENPAMIEQLGGLVAQTQGFEGASHEQIMAWGRIDAYNQIRDRVFKQWLSVGPLQTMGYEFDGLKPVYEARQAQLAAWKQQVDTAKAAGVRPPPEPMMFIQMRYKIKTSMSTPDDQVDMLVAYNKRATMLKMLSGTAQVVPLPADLVDKNGVLEIAWRNPSGANPTVTFSAKQGMQLLYQVGSFGPNLFRTVLSMWAKLSFLAMLGLVAATFLGFPVACVLALMVYAAASMSPFLTDSLRSFGTRPEDAFGMIQMVMRYVAEAVTTLVGKYADYPATSLIVDGRLFSWNALGGCLLWIGGVWTVLVGLIGWLIFRKRELARVQV